MHRLYRLLGAVVAAAAVGIAGAAAGKEPIRIGLIEPLSGPVAAIGQEALEQLTFNAKRINEGGGVLGGRPLDFVVYDNAGNAEKTTQQLRKAIDDGLRFVSQGIGSNHALNIIEQLEKHNKRNPDRSVLYLNTAAVTTAFTNELCSFWHFRFDANVDMKAAGLVTRIGSDPKVKKVYLINQNYAFGKSFQDAANRLLKERAAKVEIVGDELIVPFGKVQDFTPYVAKMKSAGADTVLTSNWGPDLIRLVKAAATAGLDVQFYTIYGGIPSSMAAMGADDMVAVNLKQITEFHPMDEGNPPALRDYMKEWFEATKKTWYGDRYRWTVEMFAAALNKAGSDDPVAVAQALEGMTFPGPGGELLMRQDDHQIQIPMVISTVSKDVSETFKYLGEDYGVGWKTDAWISREDLTLPTTCKMDRPST